MLDPTKLPTVKISQQEWDSLPEYSRSIPTERKHGKKWKAHLNGKIWVLARFVHDDDGWAAEFALPDIVPAE